METSRSTTTTTTLSNNLDTPSGEHYIDVRLYNQSVHDSPFTCNVGDPDMVTVRNMPTQIKPSDLGQDATFESRNAT